MFKILNKEKIVGVLDIWFDEYKKQIPNLIIEEDWEHTLSDYVMIGTEYVLSTDERAIEFKKNNVRNTRNFYLEKYVDPVVSNPLRWGDMPEEEKKQYSDYRQYLLDYPESSENWYEQNPLEFEEWKEQQES